mmetsp:Transcript_66805/g.183262  ORF Transcript_66805/g.183262 Transcript_66805/m.183262 type:complete len:216 (+) Transcript_66805:327-974(+)
MISRLSWLAAASVAEGWCCTFARCASSAAGSSVATGVATAVGMAPCASALSAARAATRSAKPPRPPRPQPRPPAAVPPRPPPRPPTAAPCWTAAAAASLSLLPWSTPRSCRSSAMIITIVAMAMGPPGLPSLPAQSERHFSPVNHFCSRTRPSSLRRMSRPCFHPLSTSEIFSSASSEALFLMACFHGVLGRPSSARWSASRICLRKWWRKSGRP